MRYLLFLTLLSLFCSCSEQKPAVLATNQPQSSLPISAVGGEISQGLAVDHVFTVANSSSEVLELEDLQHNFPCCVDAELNPTVLKPESEGRLTVSFDSSFRPGPISLFIQLKFIEEPEPRIFHLSYDVSEDLVVSPTGLKFTPEGGSFQLKVRGVGLGTEYKVLGFENPIPDKISISDAKNDSGTLTYKVSWLGSKTDSDIYELNLLTDHPRVQRFPIYVAGPQANPE